MLYVCPTPIGNLEDITLRVLRVFQEVDLVVAEDTRHTGQLLHHFQISRPLESLHEHNEKGKTARILDLLREGKKIALVSDAGMPGISDPGSFLLQEVIAADLPLEVLPGANAALVGFLQSGFASSQFLFYGFLPRRRKDRLQALEGLKGQGYPIIFYEAPHRLCDMLRDLLEVLGDRRISVSRELTKRFEETRRGRVKEVLDHFQTERPRGEFVITIAGGEPASDVEKSEDDILHLLEQLMSSGLSRKTAVEQVSGKYRLPKNQVYEIALRINS